MRIQSFALQLCALTTLGALTLTGCRGWTSPQPPVHLNPNMDTQEKLKPYRAAEFFQDGRAMRMPIDGTVGRTIAGNGEIDAQYLVEDEHYYTGKLGSQVPNMMPKSTGNKINME